MATEEAVPANAVVRLDFFINAHLTNNNFY